MRMMQSLGIKARVLGLKGASPRARRGQKKMVDGTWGLKLEPSRGKPQL